MVETPKLTDREIAIRFLVGPPIDLCDIPVDSTYAKMAAKIYNAAFDRDKKTKD